MLDGEMNWTRSLEYRFLDADVSRVEVSRAIPTPFDPGIIDVGWAAGRYGLLTGRPYHLDFGILDRNGSVAADWNSLGPSGIRAFNGVVARQALGGLWTLFVKSTEEPNVHGFDGTAAVVAHTLAPRIAPDYQLAEGLLSRVGLVWVQDGHLWLESVVVGAEGPLGDRLDVGVATLMFRDELGPWHVRPAISRLRDSVLVTHHTEDFQAWLTIVNPFEGTSRRSPIARTFARRIGVVGVDKHGLIGVCYHTGEREPATAEGSGIAFRLFGADGSPIGEPVHVADNVFSSVDCAVGFHEDSFVVVWGQADETRTERTLILARRVRPRMDL